LPEFDAFSKVGMAAKTSSQIAVYNMFLNMQERGGNFPKVTQTKAQINAEKAEK
jgi:hypothetical protein